MSREAKSIPRGSRAQAKGNLRWLLLTLSVAGLLMGCPNSHPYTTARVVETGKFQHTQGVEFMSFNNPSCDPAVDTCNTGLLPVPFPFYVIRVGATDFLDLGSKLSFAGSISFDVKIQLVRSEYFDLALDPGMTASVAIGYAHLPVIASFNVGPVTLSLMPKVSYGYVWGVGDQQLPSGLLAGGAFSAQIRIGHTAAITPAVEWQRLFFDPTGLGIEFDMLSFGVAVSFGGMPVHGAGAQAPPESAPPPGYAEPGPPAAEAPPGEPAPEAAPPPSPSDAPPSDAPPPAAGGY